MLKYIFYLILIGIVIALIMSGFHLYRVAMRNKNEMAPYSGPAVQVDKNFGKVLVIYYSLSGHTKEIAEKIAQKTDADVYEIKTAERISQNPVMYYKIKQQLKSGQYPKLVGAMPDASQYDMIFVGAPVWWYTVATPGLSFLNEMDFQGKKVAPFSTQGSNFGTYFDDFAKKAKNAKLLQSASFNNLPEKYNPAVDNKIAVWLNSLQTEQLLPVE